MSNDQNLLAELRRHNLLKTLLQRQIIAEAVGHEQLSPDDLKAARHQFLKANGLKDDESLNAYLAEQGWSEDDLSWQISLPLRITEHCRRNYYHKAEARFLVRKNQLDQVVYSLLRTKDQYLAQELYLRIEAGEADFGDLSSQFSEGQERNAKGIIGPVSMTQAHPTVAEILRTTKPGVLIFPQQVADWWLIMRLESYTPANFDKAMADRLSKELFGLWVNEELTRKMASYLGRGVAPSTE